MGKIISRIILVFIVGIVVLKIFFLISTEEEYINISPIGEVNGCIGLNYHRVRTPNWWNKTVELVTQNKELTTYNVYADEFEYQMTQLQEAGVYFASLNDLSKFRESNTYPQKCVWISFDDVEESVYENAFPILKSKNIPFTLFVITGHVGTKNFNNLQLSSWDELREMQESGLVSFGSHTYDMHYLINNKAVFLNSGYQSEFKDDILRSKEIIETELGVNISTIAYPYGVTSDEITEIVKECGFKSAFILHSAPITNENDVYYQNRYLMDKRVFADFILPWVNNTLR